jgi:hypothetical protein
MRREAWSSLFNWINFCDVVPPSYEITFLCLKAISIAALESLMHRLIIYFEKLSGMMHSHTRYSLDVSGTAPRLDFSHEQWQKFTLF